jgi:hypothetical protein
MEINKHLFCSQLNSSLIVAFLSGTVVSIWLFYLPPLSISVWLLILAGALFNYLILATFQSRYYFYEDRMVRIFIFRPFYRKTVFKYEQIFKIKFIRTYYPEFIVYRRKKQFFSYFNSFLFNKQNERIQIVGFLLSKNVKMEVRSDFEKKDKEIIDMVKKKYPNNIRYYV